MLKDIKIRTGTSFLISVHQNMNPWTPQDLRFKNE